MNTEGVATSRGAADGKAKPFLTTKGAAAFEKLLKNQEVVGLLHREIQIGHSRRLPALHSPTDFVIMTPL